MWFVFPGVTFLRKKASSSGQLICSLPLQVILSQSQDKALRRIGELREVWLCVLSVSQDQYPSSHLIKVFCVSEHVEWCVGASNGPAGEETPTGRVWCCARGERPDDNCAPNTGKHWHMDTFFWVRQRLQLQILYYMTAKYDLKWYFAAKLIFVYQLLTLRCIELKNIKNFY